MALALYSMPSEPTKYLSDEAPGNIFGVFTHSANQPKYWQACVSLHLSGAGHYLTEGHTPAS